MSMVARTEPRPAEDDITDTDDGDKRYLELAEKREANESFVYGWIKERVAA